MSFRRLLAGQEAASGQVTFFTDNVKKVVKNVGVLPDPPVSCTASQAGIAQLVERNLAKVEVASSSLVSRSRFQVPRRFGGADKLKSLG